MVLSGRRVARSALPPRSVGVRRSGASPGSALLRGQRRRDGQHRRSPRTCIPSLDPLQWPAAARGAGHRRPARRPAGLGRPAGAGRPRPVGPTVEPRAVERASRDPLRARHDHLRRRARARRCATSTSPSPRASSAWSSAAPDRGRRRSSAPSTDSCPHFTGGHLAGRVAVDGRDTRTHPPRELADVVGMVGQDPLAGFVTDTVEEELAYAMEQLAVPAAVMRKRVEETLDLLGIAELRDRALRDALGRPAAARRDRLGAHAPPARPRARRADVGARPDRRRGGARRRHPARARPRHHRGHGRAPARAGRAARRPRRAARRRRRRHAHGPRAGLADLRRSRRPSCDLGRLAGWDPLPLSVRDARAWRPRSATGSPSRAADPTPPARSPRPTVLDARGLVVRYGDVVAAARRRPRPARRARSSRSWAATARASRRCCGRSIRPAVGQGGIGDGRRARR